MVVIHNNYLTAEINETGAQLSRLASETTDYIWNGSTEIWPKHAPVLFPFAGRLKDQKFTYKNRSYGPVQIHGFAPYAAYTPCDKTESSVRMRMVVSDEIKAIWPFDFSFAVLFELVEWTLKVTYEVGNMGSEPMYYGMGSHPGFNVPLKEGLKFEDYYIEFPESGNVLRNVMTADTCLNTGKQEVYPHISNSRINLKHNLFDTDAVILSNTGSRAVIASEKDCKSITVEYPDTQYCAIWHKVKMEVPFVCIEPWTSLPGWADKETVLESKSDYNVLSAGSHAEHHLNITIKEN